jgi:hypothetical protein
MDKNNYPSFIDNVKPCQITKADFAVKGYAGRLSARQFALEFQYYSM